MYIARDKDGGLYIYENKPWRQLSEKMWVDSIISMDYKLPGFGYFEQLSPELYPDLTWDDEPMEVIKINEIVKVLGRGYVFVGEDAMDIHVGNKLKIQDKLFNISGVERVSHMKSVGLVISHSDEAKDLCKIGDYVEVVKL